MAGIFGAFGRLVRHGQILCIYPAAFEDPEEKESNFSIPEGLNYEQVHITTSDRIKLECLLLHASEKRRRGGRRSKASSSRADTRPTSPDSAKSTSSTHDLHHSSSRATVISFHGNGYHVWHHAYTGENFVQMGCDVFLVSYRGYGHSEGRPSEKGLRRDAQAALDYVLTHPDLSKKPIIIHGHSLGGAVAIDLVSRNPTRIHGLIIENTFLSIPLVVKDLPVLRHLALFIHQTWESRKRILDIPRTTPILMIAGKKDEIVPEKHMRGLWKLSRRRCLDKADQQEVEMKGRSSFACGGIRGMDEDSVRGASRTTVEGDEEDNPEDLQKDVYLCIANGTHADTWTDEQYWVAVDRLISSIQRT